MKGGKGNNNKQKNKSKEPAIDNYMNVFNQLLFNNKDDTPESSTHYFNPAFSTTSSNASYSPHPFNISPYNFDQQPTENTASLLSHESSSASTSVYDYNATYPSSSPNYLFNKNLQQEPSLDALILSKYQIEQEILRRKRQNDELLKKKQQQEQEELLLRNKKMKAIEEQAISDDDIDEDDYDEDEPVIGDGAQSYSSQGSTNHNKPLSKEDKRKRNTAASARFRFKKKLREQALQKTACEMTDKATRMEQRVHELEREIKWLRALVVEKNQDRIKQLIRERPLHSTAFPINRPNNNESMG